ncbi:MAG: galactonate dehydratase [Akkermansiaceae bacterium]
MRITKLHLYKVPPRWVFLEIETDEGVSGWGEPVIEGRAETVMAAVRELEPMLIGQDPEKINDLWNAMYRGGFYRGGPILMSAIAGVDQALWDLKGKALGQPITELLGGRVREKMKSYCWVGGDNPEDEISQIEKARAKGLDTFKLNGCGALPQIASHREIDEIVNRISAIRAHFGNEIDFALDFHGRVSLSMARVLLRELETTRPLFVEEPVLPEYARSYRELADLTSIPLAAGERAYSRFDFLPILESGGLSIIQPDLSHAGGITECLKIASLAETFHVSLAPHCPLGPIALASCLAVDFISPNAVLQEQSVGIHYNDGVELTDYVRNKTDFGSKDGWIAPLRLPGLGVDIDREFVIEQSKVKHDWKNPVWRHEDGSISEW